MYEVPKTRDAGTDVAEFITDLDGGQLETMLSVALSQTAAAVVDHGSKGKVLLEMTFDQIKGTHQVVVSHKLVFKAPTMLGSKSETVEGDSVLHVGKGGKLSLAQQSLMREGKQQALPGA